MSAGGVPHRAGQDRRHVVYGIDTQSVKAAWQLTLTQHRDAASRDRSKQAVPADLFSLNGFS